MFKNAEYGEYVYSLAHGYGRIVGVHKGLIYGIEAKFGDIVESFTFEGKMVDLEHTIPILFRTKPETDIWLRNIEELTQERIDRLKKLINSKEYELYQTRQNDTEKYAAYLEGLRDALLIIEGVM